MRIVKIGCARFYGRHPKTVHPFLPPLVIITNKLASYCVVLLDGCDCNVFDGDLEKKRVAATPRCDRSGVTLKKC
jgi:hypothetical protein